MERLSPEQARILACVLDAIVPPSADGRMPGAGALGLADPVSEFVARTPGALAALAAALDALEAQGFASLAVESRPAALDPAFVAGLVFPTYTTYYREPRVYAALGLEPRPPHPKGHALEPGGFAGLEAVRRRGKIYREC
jgi:hypothetical protein